MDLSLFILLATLPVLIIAWVVMRAMVRRRQIREIARFHESPRVSDADFLEVGSVFSSRASMSTPTAKAT